MHTSTALTSSDFAFWQWHHDQRSSIPFADFCPNYHELDRVGVVSPRVSDGVLSVGQSLLALTTAFYNCHRERGGDFFDYPQHFAFVGQNSDETGRDRSSLDNLETWGAWSKLDVWPAEKWVPTKLTANGMIQAIFEHQINRLFWPQYLWPQPNEEALPDYSYRMLATRLKSVYLYNPKGGPIGSSMGHSNGDTRAMVEVTTSPAVEAVLQTSYDQLPAWDRPRMDGTRPSGERFWPMPVSDFIQSIRPTTSR